jgi:hypothetical protein
MFESKRHVRIGDDDQLHCVNTSSGVLVPNWIEYPVHVTPVTIDEISPAGPAAIICKNSWQLLSDVKRVAEGAKDGIVLIDLKCETIKQFS